MKQYIPSFSEKYKNKLITPWKKLISYDEANFNDYHFIDKAKCLEEITKDNVEEYLGDCDGILVPGGFGDRGVEGKIEACRYAREKDVPYLGICLGMQN